MSRSFQILLLCLCLSATCYAEGAIDAATKIDLASRITGYVNEMNSLGENLSNLRPDQLQGVSRYARILDARWNGFYQGEVAFIAEDEELLGLVADYEQARAATLDSLNTRKVRIEKTTEFVKAEKVILSKAPNYRNLRDKAFKLSLTKQTAPLLEQMKAKEQLDFAEIEAAYRTAGEAASMNPKLKGRMNAVQEKYLEIKGCSDEIQGMEFVPFVDRIKNYVMSLAAVSIIMMFGVFISNYIKTAKTAKESAKKMEEVLHQNDQNIPTI